MAMLFAPAVIVGVVVTVTVASVPGKMEDAVMLPDTPAGADAVSETLFFELPVSVTLIVNVMLFPATAVPLLVEGVKTKSTRELLTPPPHDPTSASPSTEPRPVARL